MQFEGDDTMTKWIGRAFVVVYGVFLASAASAQTNAVIAGVVRDATGAFLPGVTVEASSPALIERARTATNTRSWNCVPGSTPSSSRCLVLPR